jgi:hypothetical protein
MTTIQAHKSSIRHAALCLWADAVWTDEAMNAFVKESGNSSPMLSWGREITNWPLPPMPDEFVAVCAETLEKAENAWGRSLSEIADEIGESLDDLCYSICMQAVGHGVGPNDYVNWPISLDTDEIPRIENPALGYLPYDPEQWAKLCLVTDGKDVVNIRDYSACWGRYKGDGPLFYNYASHDLYIAEEYDSLLTAIDHRIEEVQSSADMRNSQTEVDQDVSNLTRLYNFVLWERINLFGRVTDLMPKAMGS